MIGEHSQDAGQRAQLDLLDISPLWEGSRVYLLLRVVQEILKNQG